MSTETQKVSPERRLIDFDEAELRAADDESGSKITGWVAKYNVWSPRYGRFRERIAPGFFDPAIGRDDVRALFNHDPNFILARTKSGTLRLRSNETGLHMEADAPTTDLVKGLVLEPIRRRDVTGASFSFTILEDTWAKGADGVMERTLLRIDQLFDVGPVTFPFYPDTDMALRSLESWEAAQATEEPVGDLALKSLKVRLAFLF